MILFYFFVVIVLLSVFFTFKLKKPGLLLVPIGAMGLYIVVQIAMVPLGFFETLKFIFSLR